MRAEEDHQIHAPPQPDPRLADSERTLMFFSRYEAALLARDAAAVARLYSVPGLIVFPGSVISVRDSAQTREFFRSAWDQYDGVEETSRQMRVIAETSHSVWVDVTWAFPNRPDERFCYQLVQTGDNYQIGVLAAASDERLSEVPITWSETEEFSATTRPEDLVIVLGIGRPCPSV